MYLPDRRPGGIAGICASGSGSAEHCRAHTGHYRTGAEPNP
jgi:hypothetical protein